MKKKFLIIALIIDFLYLIYCLYILQIWQPKEIASCNQTYEQLLQKAKIESTENTINLMPANDCDNIERSFLEILFQKPIQRGFQQ